MVRGGAGCGQGRGYANERGLGINYGDERVGPEPLRGGAMLMSVV